MQKLYKFKQGETFVLLDINSGAVYEIDEEAFNMPENELLKLVGDNGDNYMDYAEANIDAPLKAICLHVSHDCNLRCKYCFAEDNVRDKSVMSPETAKKAVDFLISGSHERRHLEMDFFGGEPLMAWETVTETVKYADEQAKKHDKEFKFTLTTNGLLLNDEKTAYINENMSNVVLSLDGRRKINDNMRGTGTYNKIMPKFKKLVNERNKPERTDYYIRGTFTAENLDFANDVIAIANEGFKNISIEPVTVSEKIPYALTMKHLPQIESEYDRLFEIMRGNKDGWSFFHFNIDLAGGPCILKRLRGCGAGNEYIAVDPEGNIFPCHRFVGIDKWKMGNINNIILDKNIKGYFSKTHIYAKEKCVSCWARFYCGGGCNAENYIFEGDARTPSELFCGWMKKRIECAVALAIERMTKV